MSVLTDFYNLELDDKVIEISEISLKQGKIPDWHTPEKDKEKVIAFFDQYAIAEILLTVYQGKKKESWFDGLGAWDFYNDYREVRTIVDTYLSKKTIIKEDLVWIIRLVKKGKSLKDKDSEEILEIDKFPKEAEIDLNKYTCVEASLSFHTWRLCVDVITGNLVNELISKLQSELIDLLNGELEIRRCEAEGCGKIFRPSPQGSKQRFCSKACRQKMYRLRRKS